MNRTLSSAWTFFLKYLLLALWIPAFMLRVTPAFSRMAAIVPGGMHGADPAWIRWTFLLFGLVGAAFIVLVCTPLKRVRLDRGALVVSNYLREWRIPLGLVTEVTQNRWLQVRPITIRLRADMGCGTRIVFIPKRYVRPRFWREDPEVGELRRVTGLGAARR
ncbi:MAG TPA: hypothetical protein VF041_03115 [Gemmatimonadaceae bacterium]